MSHRRKESKVIVIGTVAYILGIIFRLNETEVAWPNEYSYSGERANTVWAIKEQVILDIGLSLMVFGLVIIVISIISILWNTQKQTKE